MRRSHRASVGLYPLYLHYLHLPKTQTSCLQSLSSLSFPLVPVPFVSVAAEVVKQPAFRLSRRWNWSSNWKDDGIPVVVAASHVGRHTGT